MMSMESQLLGESLDGFMASNKKIFFLLGFWPVDSEPRNGLYHWRTFFRWCCFCILIEVLFVVQLYDLYLMRDDLLSMCEEFMIITFIIVAILICVSVINMDEHKSLILFLQELNQPERLTDDIQRQMSEATQWICNMVSIGIHVVTIVGICILTSLYFMLVYLDLYPPRTLFIRGFYAWDTTADPFYQITMTCQWIIMAFIVNLILAYNVLMNVVIIHVITQFRILGHKLENLRAHAVRNVLLRRDNQEEKNREDKNISKEFTGRHRTESAQEKSEDNDIVIQDIVDDLDESSHQPLYRHSLFNAIVEKKEKVTVVDPTLGFHIETEKLGENAIVADDDASEVHMEMQRILGECMEHYKQCKRCGDLLSGIFYIRMLYLMGWNIVGIIVLALYTKLAPGFDIKQLAAVIVVVVGLIDFLILSAISSELTHQSSLIGESLYSCDWLDAPEDFKRTMRIFMTAVNQPVVVYVAGYLPMSLETFLTVMNNTYSYYLVMSDVTAK